MTNSIEELPFVLSLTSPSQLFAITTLLILLRLLFTLRSFLLLPTNSYTFFISSYYFLPFLITTSIYHPHYCFLHLAFCPILKRLFPINIFLSYSPPPCIYHHYHHIVNLVLILPVVFCRLHPFATYSSYNSSFVSHFLFDINLQPSFSLILLLPNMFPALSLSILFLLQLLIHRALC